jgi:hypothetical protein
MDSVLSLLVRMIAPITRGYLSKVERRIGGSLPVDYRDFIIGTGGTFGVNGNANFEAEDGEKSDVAVFFGRSDERKGHNVLATFNT